MNDAFFYPDSCVITRGTGTTTSGGTEIFSSIYTGKCNVQYSQGGNTSLQGNTYQSTPTLILPLNTCVFKINDIVVVTTSKGRVINYSIEQFEDIEDTKVEGTTIWLKQGNDV